MPNTSLTPCATRRLDERLGGRHLLPAGNGEVGGVGHRAFMAGLSQVGGDGGSRLPDLMPDCSRGMPSRTYSRDAGARGATGLQRGQY